MRWQSFVAGCVIAVLAFGVGATWSQKSTSAQEEMQPPEWTKQTAEHQKLKESVGEFTVAGEFWMEPGAEAQKFDGTAERKIIMNGYFLEETFKSEWQGQPFEGRLIQGYDTIAKEYVSVWFDNMSPILSISRGEMKDGAMVLTGRQPDFMTGKLKDTKSVVEEMEGKVKMAMFDVGEDGTEHMTMRFVYKKKGAEKEKKKEGGW